MVYIHRLFVIFGGFSTGNYSNETYSFDSETKTFETLNTERRPKARISHSAVGHNDKMFIFGGKTINGKFLNDLWEFSIKENIWRQIEYEGDIPKVSL